MKEEGTWEDVCVCVCARVCVLILFCFLRGVNELDES